VDKCTVLDLSRNLLKEKSGIYLGNALAANTSLKMLALDACEMEAMGV
jgi:Ran GTPase-activating protein (RanGAP) involved in mRNA processing and transport